LIILFIYKEFLDSSDSRKNHPLSIFSKSNCPRLNVPLHIFPANPAYTPSGLTHLCPENSLKTGKPDHHFGNPAAPANLGSVAFRPVLSDGLALSIVK
jgi:hypothetical protein